MPARRLPLPTAAMWSRPGASRRAAARASCWPMIACGPPTSEYDARPPGSKRRGNESLGHGKQRAGEPSRACRFAIATHGREGQEVYHAATQLGGSVLAEERGG